MTWSARSYPRTSCIGPGPRPSSGSCPTPGIRLGNRGFSARWSTPPNASSARLRSPADWRKTNKNAAASRGVFLFPEQVSDTQYLHRFRERGGGRFSFWSTMGDEGEQVGITKRKTRRKKKASVEDACMGENRPQRAF